MRAIMLAAVLSLAAFGAQAESCKVSATGKKLHGAALNSFMKKCATDAKMACDKSAADKKLAGAAKNSHVKKCLSDAVGT
jgi:ribosomal protein L12E/L44/L45/RPP1/RPP2